MNKLYLFLFLFLIASITSCEEEGSTIDPAPDLTNAVKITYPAEQDSFMLIENLSLDAQIEASLVLKRVTVYLTYPDGVRSIADLRLITYDNPFQKEYGFSVIPSKEMAPGLYTITVEALDYDQKVYRDSVSVMLHKPTIALQDFTKAFDHVTVFTASDWYGYNLKDGYDLYAFNFSFYLVADTDVNIAVSEKEWQNFVTDFRLNSQSFSDFDLDKSGGLDDIEFDKAMLTQHIFNQWDQNKDDKIVEAEMARGIFSSWDLNQDRFLNDTEYHDKFYTYLKH